MDTGHHDAFRRDLDVFAVAAHQVVPGRHRRAAPRGARRPARLGRPTLVGVVISKDLALFPAMRVAFRPPPATDRLVRTRGQAVEQLRPAAYVRVNREFWQAELQAPGRQIDAGTPIVVRDATGLTLIVEHERAASLQAHRD